MKNKFVHLVIFSPKLLYTTKFYIIYSACVVFFCVYLKVTIFCRYYCLQIVDFVYFTGIIFYLIEDTALNYYS